MGIYIFEGPDGTGKTSIAKALAEKLKLTYFKYNSEHDYWRKGEFKTALEFDQPFMLQYLQQSRANIVWDRAWPSEWVYSQAFNRDTNMDVLRMLDDQYSKLNTWIIIPMRTDYTKNKPDDIIPANKVPLVHDYYDKFCDWTKCNTLRIYVDTMQNNIEYELRAITSVTNNSWPGFKMQIVVEGR